MNSEKTEADQLSPGHAFERDFFGVHSASFEPGKTAKISSERLLLRIDEMQKREFRWDPRNPKTALASTLLNRVRDFIPALRAPELGIWCAIGTSFDFHRGVDGWMSLDLEFKRIVTFDLTVAGWKHSFQADVIIHRDRLERKLDETASMLAKRIIRNHNLWKNGFVRKIGKLRMPPLKRKK